MREKENRAWMEVSMKSLAHNYKALRELLDPQCRLMGVIKSNAYGHGTLPMAHSLEELGADFLGVACLSEALELREGGIRLPILILGVTPQEDMALLARYDLTQTVVDREMAAQLSAVSADAGVPIRIHIKVDTGMGRLGLLCDEAHLEAAADEILELCRLPGLVPEGIFTHFSNADEDDAFTRLQFTRFSKLLDKLEGAGLRFPLRHTANSAATLRHRFSHLDMVRVGLALYGYGPEGRAAAPCDLIPVMELKSRLVSLRLLPAGTPISYGSTAILDKPRTIGVVSIGYGDGYWRGFSNRHSVSIAGKRAPIVGRVCMDMCMVDLTDIPEAALGDEVILYSRAVDSPHSLEAAAQCLGTIPYELICGLSKRLPRVYDVEGTNPSPAT